MANFRSRGLQLIPYNDHEEWLKIRRGYIGGSDAGAIIGLNPYSSAFSVWAEKTGHTREFEGNVATKVGTELEDFVAHMFMEETGKKVQRVNATIVNPKFPFACANVDREILGEDALLEIKTTNSWDVSKMTRNGQYPDQWLCQMTHYLAVTGCERAYLAVLVECRELKVFTLERDQEELEALMGAEGDFWDKYVLTGETPPTDGHSATSDTLKRLYPVETEETADLSDMETLFIQRRSMKEAQKTLDDGITEIENEIKARMGTAAIGKCGAFSVTWKTQRSSQLDRDAIRADYPDFDFSKYAKTSRSFRINEKKGAKQ